MPQRPIDSFWMDRLRLIVANAPAERLPRPVEVAAQFAAQGAAVGRSDYPSQRTIERKLKLLRDMPRDTLRPYREVRWPESFLAREPGLPWEASSAVIELTHQLGRPPHYSLAVWFWRCTLARPSLGLEDRLLGARVLRDAERARDSGESLRRAGEWFAGPDWPQSWVAHRTVFADWSTALDALAVGGDAVAIRAAREHLGGPE